MMSGNKLTFEVFKAFLALEHVILSETIIHDCRLRLHCLLSVHGIKHIVSVIRDRLVQ